MSRYGTGVLNEITGRKIVRNRELMVKTKSGEKKYILFSGSFVKSKTGRVIGSVCVIRDITERKSMEDRLVKAEKLASIGELAGQIGHDLRNPLTSIKNGVYFLGKKGERITEPQRKLMLGTMDNAVEDANRIVTSLIDYSSALDLQIGQSTPKALILNALSKTEVPNTIRVENNVMDNTSILCDVLKLETVFASLTKNAFEAIDGEGTIQINAVRKESNIEVSISDSGCGIPQSVLPKLFSPLVTSKAKGMGMSLAICKRIVEANGGKIAVQTVEGKGTTFTVTLPIKLSKKELQFQPEFLVDLKRPYSLPVADD